MNKSIEIPFTIEKRRIIVFASINGIKGKYLWDTGAEISLLNNNNCKNKFVENNYLIYSKSNISKMMKFYELNKICIENNIIKSKSLIGKTPNILKNKLKPINADGILGLHIFSGYWCELSFSKQKIILHKNKPEEYIKRKKLKCTDRGLFIYSKINNKKYELKIDTGCPYSIKINDPYFPRRKAIKIFKSSPDYKGFYHKIPANFNLFNNTINNRYITYTQNKKDYGLIGFEYLLNYDILFDLNDPLNNGKYIYFKKTSDLNYLRNFIFPRNLNNNFIVDYWTCKNGIKFELNKRNSLFKHGINQDTLIIEINGIPINKYNLNLLKTQELSKDIYELTIMEGNKRKKIKLLTD